MIRFFVASLASLAVSGAALAASTGTGNPAGMAPSAPQAKPGMPAQDVLNENDRLFIRETTIGGTAEVQVGQLAERKARTDAVKQFARQMVQDHRKANASLADIAKMGKVPQPDQLDEEHRAMAGQLEKLNGNGFDLAYINGQIGDHQKAAQLLEWEIGSGENEQLKSYAADTLPVVLQHLEMAQDVQDTLAGRAPGAGAPQISEKPKNSSP